MAAPEAKEQGGGAEAAPQAAAQGGGISTGLFLGVAGGVTVLLLGAGFAIAQFVLVPGAVKALEARQASAHAEAGAEGHGEKEKPAAKEGEKKADKKDEKPSEGEKKEEKAKEGEAKGKEGAKEGGKEGAKEAAVPKDFILSEIYVNIKGTRGTRILKASLFFDAPKGMIAKLEEERPKIIDIVSQILASKTLDQLNAEDIRGVLKDDIMSKVNAILGGNTVQNIYFLDFVVQ